jgi:hypothetical protein
VKKVRVATYPNSWKLTPSPVAIVLRRGGRTRKMLWLSECAAPRRSSVVVSLFITRDVAFSSDIPIPNYL